MQEAYCPPCSKRTLCCSGGEGGTYSGGGYLPWWGVPTLVGEYLPWWGGYLPWGIPTLVGVLTLVGGTYSGEGTYPGGGVPT